MWGWITTITQLMELEEAIGLGRQTVVKTLVWGHLQLQQHHWEVRATDDRVPRWSA